MTTVLNLGLCYQGVGLSAVLHICSLNRTTTFITHVHAINHLTLSHGLRLNQGGRKNKKIRNVT
jgi:hypothetical protein